MAAIDPSFVTSDTANGFFWGSSKQPTGSRKNGALHPFVPTKKTAKAPPPADKHAREFYKKAQATKPEPTNYSHVLTTLISVLRQQLLPSKDKTLFVPPSAPILKGSFAPAEIQREHPEYFRALRREAAQERDRRKQLAGMDKEQYVFDRKAVWTRPQSDVLAEKQALAKAWAIGSPNKSPSKRNGTAGADSVATRSEQQFEAALRWSEMQAKGMAQKRKRSEHVLAILTEEMENEISRQRALYSCKPEDVSRERFRVARERAEAADWIMRILHGYGMLKESVFMEYLGSTLESDELLLLKEMRGIRDGRRIGITQDGVAKDMTEFVTDDMLLDAPEDIATKKMYKRWKKETRKKPDLRRKDAARIKAKVKVWVDGKLQGETDWDNLEPRYDMASAKMRAIADGRTGGADLPFAQSLQLGHGSLTATPTATQTGQAAAAHSRRSSALLRAGASTTAPLNTKPSESTPQRTAKRSGRAPDAEARRARRLHAKKGNGKNVRVQQPNLAMKKTDVEEAVDAEYETDKVRDTVKLMYELMSQQAKEPPNGRYSHLLGRWYAF